ncbi:MAG: YggS family pyridoxal phosphate-dependent enzyme [Bacillota bacterium]|nr:YggS family pyridoxal phosphate-dependent enzyme [Bacillota bacterium]
MAIEHISLAASLEQRLRHVQNAIADAATRAGRRPEDITLIGVSKQFPPETALAAFSVGIHDLAENKVQDLLVKQAWLASAGAQPNWHLIGTLQRNKVRQVVGLTHLIHSVDSCKLLEEISKRSVACEMITDVLLQVNSSEEESKHGFSPDLLPAAAESSFALPGIRMRGLMTIAQLTAEPEETKPVFDKTRVLFELIGARLGKPAYWTILSMGMSQDYVQAIECGATHVRVGSALFGPRIT